ncbi:DUF2076 family protein [Aeromonas veronii]|uniref:DUF2076 family protein n=1 Tax=Aeromonas veronii TaxID=654 RepID=UPI002445236B|nr:DUF2076 family protein [Aeromonas veronii]
MQSQEQGLIDGLFDRLKQAQARDSKRDPQADQLIHQHLAQQPDAPLLHDPGAADPAGSPYSPQRANQGAGGKPKQFERR